PIRPKAKIPVARISESFFNNICNPLHLSYGTADPCICALAGTIYTDSWNPRFQTSNIIFKKYDIELLFQIISVFSGLSIYFFIFSEIEYILQQIVLKVTFLNSFNRTNTMLSAFEGSLFGYNLL
ncbi:MAG: hypothetical protein IJV18_09570, partial [Acidaminococcaceae bacterium]|nr:hypothetical protein [Acidaminococcaceae bacterium]